jgi:hypothetical protein
VGLLASTPVFAGSFTTDFSPGSTGYTLAGTGTPPGGYLTNYLGVNRAVLAIPVAGTAGSVTVWDSSLDNGQAIESFVANFQLYIGQGNATPADGVSFNFGPDITDGLISSEEGPGGTALTVSFDIYVNADVGQVSPTVHLKYGGNVIASHPFTDADMVDNQLDNVIVQLTREGKVSVTYKGVLIHDNVLIPGWAPTFGLFNFSARSGGSWAEQEIANLSITTVLQGAAVAPSIATPPVSATVNEHGTTNFTVTVNGTAPFTFQWTDNGADIAGETGTTLTMANIPYTENNHQIRVRVGNPANVNGVTSAAATLTVIRDTTPPTVLKANASSDGTQVTVVFSKAVSDTILDMSNFGIDQGVIISYPTRSSDTTVVLYLTAPLPGGQSFTLSIHGVQDTSSTPNTMAPTQVTFRSSMFQAGAVLHKKYTDPTTTDGTSFATLKNDPRYPNSPDRQDIMSFFEYPAGGSGRDTVADPNGNLASPGNTPNTITYSDTLECFFTPPTTNDYVFFATGADLNDVYLSTDTDPANMVNIAQVSGWTNAREWGVWQCGTSNGYRSDWYTGNMWTGAGDPNAGMAQIHLDGGQKYYMLAFHHRDSWSGGDDFAVTFAYYTNPPVNAPTNAPWGTAYPASGTAPALTGGVLGAYLDPTGASVSFSQQPTDVTVLQGRTATFTAQATGQSLYGTNVVYQWQTAPSGSATFTNLPGATKNSYTTPATVLTDSGRQYKVLASVPGYTVPSSVVKLTVNADTIPPVLVSVAAMPSQTGSTMDVGVTFDEPLDATSAGTLANYTISAGTITAVKYFAVSPGVVLTVSGLTAGTAYSVTVTGVADVNGNKITSANLPGTYSSMHWGVVGGDELQLGNGVVAVGPNAFDIYSDSIGAWGAYDEATFVYEQVTGPFDKEMRVEYVDPASQWARAGLIVRDVPNFGVNRAAQTGSGSTTPPWDGVASRYQKVHVQPVITAMGTAGADDYESNRRLDTGGQTDGPQTVGHTPAYPNAWVRLQRVGQTFTKFASDDGVNWINLGSTTWGVDDTNHIAMPDTLYVGPDYAPENGNVSVGFKAMFGIKVREYRNHGAVAPPTVTATENADGTFTLTYTGTLVSSDTAKGTYTAVSGASSPWKVNPKVTGAKAIQFYRAQQ